MSSPELNQEAAEDILSSIQKSIEISDNKAASLLTAIGIIFGLSAFSISELHSKSSNQAQFVCICVFGIAYLISFLVSITLLVSVIFPRRKHRKDRSSHFYKRYSEDVYRSFQSKTAGEILGGPTPNEVLLLQIERCSQISHWKETLLRCSVFSISAFALFLTALIVLAFL